MNETSEENWYSEEAATFGDRLSAARDAQGMSQKDFAKRLGISLKTVEAWENDISEPRANKLQMVSGLLNVSMKWLLTGEGQGPDQNEVLTTSADVNDLMAEMRVLRTQMSQAAEKIGVLEKRLKSAFAAA